MTIPPGCLVCRLLRQAFARAASNPVWGGGLTRGQRKPTGTAMITLESPSTAHAAQGLERST